MHVVLFCHSLLSDWNHGNAHFLRGIVTELQSRGHEVAVFEPRDAWSITNLLAEAGPLALAGVREHYPGLEPVRYELASLDLDQALDGADLVLVHEWSDPALVARIGRRKAAGAQFDLLFHDTHHRSVTEPDAMSRYELDAYDGVLAFGEVIRERYVARGWARRAWTWHEAADSRLFRPSATLLPKEGDVVWIGNWGDEERSQEIRDYLLRPVRELGLRARVHGVRYPDDATAELAAAGIDYAGWVPNYRVPDVFARFGATVHIPRRPYADNLPGIPTIRMFEALACGIPVVSCWWDDCEGLFRQGRDYLTARTPEAMGLVLKNVLTDSVLASSLVESGRETVLARHTCAHRVDELFAIVGALKGRPMEKALTI